MAFPHVVVVVVARELVGSSPARGNPRWSIAEWVVVVVAARGFEIGCMELVDAERRDRGRCFVVVVGCGRDLDRWCSRFVVGLVASRLSFHCNVVRRRVEERC